MRRRGWCLCLAWGFGGLIVILRAANCANEFHHDGFLTVVDDLQYEFMELTYCVGEVSQARRAFIDRKAVMLVSCGSYSSFDIMGLINEKIACACAGYEETLVKERVFFFLCHYKALVTLEENRPLIHLIRVTEAEPI